MGATTFIISATGSTAQEAFDAAVQHAQLERGNGGYTGTIAEKDSFVMIRDTEAQIVNRLSGSDLERFNQKHTKHKAVVIANALLDLDDDRISDKYGPAGCIQIEKNHWLFFGWASE